MIPAPVILNCGARLATDVRDNLTVLTSFLRNLRASVAARHNMAVLGAADRVLSMHPLEDYLANVGEGGKFATAYHTFIVASDVYYERMQSAVSERFSFSDEEDLQFFTDLINTELMQPSVEGFNRTGVTSLTEYLPAEALEGDPKEISEKIESLAGAWLWTADAGLLWRALCEVRGIADGYENNFWSHLEWLKSPALAPGQPAAGFLVDVTMASEQRAEGAAGSAAKSQRRSFW